ncbi:carboxypeptidase-like regulatory domain-containing protein [Muricauda sp. SCSIO 64092]|uniref:carboxypeptidase-like regulatory domain-containing protein n=1 Tax=Allomuricauda sp. SCSIO 64092 TaxID=2908842 RepID=UPI001FF1F58E|nr:carboxypeptidase-like regulatory domain-containing protein [Muricauda sp. SCSIO 64092]UOY07432.1 carboxypeptidase-like regulatory domain-containing protein [Muricauda sp. SCSIO 64092]
MMNRFDVLRSRCAKSNPILFFVLIVSIMVSGCGSDNEAQDSITGTLIVVVSTSDGTPEPNASVTLIPGNSTLVTDDQGTVRFNDLELGTYQVTVELSMDSNSFVEGLIYEFSVTLSEENDTETLEVEVIDPVQTIQETDPDIDVLLANTGR